MRKYFKTQCMELLSSLEEAHKQIKDFIAKKNYSSAMQLLEDCQQGAIQIGTTIDEIEGEGTEAVHVLEDYCEVIYKIHETLDKEQTVNFRQEEKRLRKIVSKAKAKIRDTLPTQYEIVFLPYKASMWDSLESVWKEKDADPDVTAIVIPIPYYDKNPDGSFKEIHYEATQFPQEVPITGYKNYNLEERHPDAIYIHNPYDDANIVTSVVPDFYSDKLRKYTDELVYIPYFILGDIDPSNEEAVEGVEHFITVPAVYNAHRVIVQSEDWKKVYVKVMTKYTGKENKAYWEAKIEGSGSPKVDRVLNLKETDFILPEEWKAVTTKPDGSRKKIIFYNNSVGSLLQQNDAMLEKIKRNLEIFKENKNEVALLWRPHPLMEATLTSMRPDLWEKYRTIVEEYRNANWGIYDDSAELDRAIAISDAYYGDWSSVVWLYKQTGKPIMIQNCEV